MLYEQRETSRMTSRFTDLKTRELDSSPHLAIILKLP